MCGAEECVLDGALARIENSRYRSQLQAMIMLQFENHALARREVAQRTDDVLAQHAACQIAIRACADAVIGYAIQEFLFLSVWGTCDSQFIASGALPAKVIKTEIRSNAIDPRIKRTLETKPRQMYKGAQKSFLINILTILLRAGEVNGQAKYRPVILLHELPERCGIALLCCPNQPYVVCATVAIFAGRGHRGQCANGFHVFRYATNLVCLRQDMCPIN